MNQDTGEIREFGINDLIPEKWVEWKLEEVVELKGCKFRVIQISVAEQTITLKGIGKGNVR